MNYTEAIQYLNSFVNYEELSTYDYKTSFKLERMRLLSKALGDPHRSFKTIHITGTKGKGSTAAITASILKAGGSKAGLYTSPHLASFRERIKINGEDIREEEVARAVSEVKDAAGKLDVKDFTFFELYTAAAFLYFKIKKIDLAVIEVGLGGRLDATNIIRPLVSCITPISLEHTHLLGPRLEDITREKADIIKKGSVCVSAPQRNEAAEIILSRCLKKGVRLYLVGKDILYESICTKKGCESFSVFGRFGEYPHLEMALLGEHQLVNAATAIGIIEALRSYDIVTSFAHVKDGVAGVRWPARLEILGERPLMVLDGAQNKASAVALKKAVKRCFKFDKLVLVLGISRDKDMPNICSELEEISDEIILTKADSFRAEEPESLKKFFKKKARLTDTLRDALKLARETAKNTDMILITGSLYVAGEARQYLQPLRVPTN